MHAPGHFPNATARELHRPVSAFEADVLPSLDSPPLTCLQKAGDVVFVPDGWSHATINVESKHGCMMLHEWVRSHHRVPIATTCRLKDAWCGLAAHNFLYPNL